MIKEAIQGEDITFIKIYAPNIGAPKYIKQILTDIKGETERNKKIIEETDEMKQEELIISAKSKKNFYLIYDFHIC